MVYQWKNGSRISADPQVAGEMCERLESEGRLTAKDLLDENRPEDAPLHKVFEWNDGVAAEKWREQQARHVISSIVVYKEEVGPVREFFNVLVTEKEYKSIKTILSNQNDTQNLFETAMRELVSIQKKYSSIQTLHKIWEAIDDAATNPLGRVG